MSSVSQTMEDDRSREERGTVTHYKVKVPTERLVRVDEAEPGMLLARDVTNDVGHLLYETGEKLDRQMIRRLGNFDRRSVYVQDKESKWVDETTYQGLSESAEYLDEKQVPAPVEAVESGGAEESNFQRVYDFLSNTNSSRRLQSFVASLEEAARSRNQDELTGDLESIRAQAGDLEDILQYLLAELSQIDDPQVRRDVLARFYGDENEGRGDLGDLDNVPDEVAFELERLLNEKNALRGDLMDILHEQPDVLEGFDAEDVPRKLAMDGPDKIRGQVSGEPASLSSLYSQLLLDTEDPPTELRDVLERIQNDENLESEDVESLETELRETIPDALGQYGGFEDEFVQTVTEDTTRDLQPSAEPDENEPMLDVLESLKAGHWSESIQSLNVAVEQLTDGAALPEEFEVHRERLSKLNARKNDLAKQLEDQYEPPPGYDGFEGVLEESGDRFEDVFADYDLASDDAESLRTFRADRDGIVFEFLESLRTYLPELIDSLDDSVPSSLVESFRDLTDDLITNRVDHSQQAEFIDRDAPPSDFENERREILDRAVQDEDLSTVKKLNGLPNTVIDGINELYVRPKAMNKWQRKLIDQHRRILHHLVYGLRAPEDEINRFIRQVGEVLDKETKPFSLFLEPPDPRCYHLTHAYNTMLLSVIIGREQKRSESEMESLVLAATLADTGLTLIPDSFYLKHEELTPRAKNEIMKHPLISRKIAAHVFGADHPVPELVLHHHERLDGSGYPTGTNEGESPELAGVLGTADAYTAMLEERVYREGRLPDDVMMIMDENSEVYPDGSLDAIRRTIGYYPNGAVVKLTDGRLAFVNHQEKKAPREPKVLILTDKNRNRLDDPDHCDLADEPDLSVQNLLRT